MFSNGFLVRVSIKVIDHRNPAHNPCLPRKMTLEVPVEPGEDLYAKIDATMKDAGVRTIRDVESSPMAARVKEVRGNQATESIVSKAPSDSAAQ